MGLALRAIVALLVFASLPTFQAAPGDLIGSGHIELGGQPLGGIFGSPQPPEPGEDDNEPSAFWLDVTHGIWVETRTTTPASTGLEHEWLQSYDVNIRVWGKTHHDDGDGGYDSWGFFATCDLPTAEEICHLAREPDNVDGWDNTYTAQKIFVQAPRGIDLDVDVYEIAEPANPPVPLLDQASHLVLGTPEPEPEPGPRTQTFNVTVADWLVAYGLDFMIDGPGCTVRINDLQPGTGFYLENVEGAPWDIRFFSFDGSVESLVHDFHGVGDDWGNVPATADWACAEPEDSIPIVSSFRYTDGLATRAAGDHTNMTTYRVYHG